MSSRSFSALWRNVLLLRTGVAPFGVFCGVVGVLVSGAVLTGWATGNTTLIQIGPTLPPMQANTAACFLLGSVALILVSGPSSWFNRPAFRWTLAVCTALIGLVAFATLLQYWLGLDFGIDELLTPGYVTTGVSHPGRMSPWTAAGFAGMALTIGISAVGPVPSSARFVAMATCTSLVGLLATTMLVLYVLELDPTLGDASATGMAVHTAALFWMLSAGAGAVLSRRSAAARSAFGIVPILLGVVVTLTVRQAQVSRDVAIRDRATQAWVDDVAVRAENRMDFRVRALQRMAARASSGGYSIPGVWELDADYYASQVLSGHVIAWVDRELNLLRIEPTDEETRRYITEWLGTAGASSVADAAMRESDTRLTPSRAVSPDEVHVLVVTPIDGENGASGAIVAEVDYEPALALDLSRPDYHINLFHRGEALYPAGPEGPSSVLVAEADFQVGAETFTLRARPTEAWLAENESSLPLVILITGLTVTLLLAMATRSARAHARSQERFRALHESAPDAGLILDERGRILMANTRAERLFGMSGEELQGHHVTEILVEDTVFQDWTGEEILPTEVQGRRPDGVQLPLEMSLSTIEASEGTLVAASLRDVTARKAVEEQLKESDRMKSEFVSTVSHEMRTPLTIIREFTSLVSDGTAGPVSADQADYLGTVIRNCDRLTGLIGDLLELARLQSGKYRMDRRAQRLEDVVGRCLDDFTPLASSNGIDLRTSVDVDLPEVLCDDDRITQVLVNLVGNAVKFTEAGGTIVIGAERSDPWVEVWVADTGIGIAPEDQSKIFGAFVQVGRTEGPGARGTGLGLNVARQIVELHGGEMWMESEVGVGSKFSFTLPAQEKGALEAFLARQAPTGDGPLGAQVRTLVLLREKVSVEDRADLETAHQIVAGARRVGRDEVLLDRGANLLVIALHEDIGGAAGFVRRLLTSLADTRQNLDYALEPAAGARWLDETVEGWLEKVEWRAPT